MTKKHDYFFPKGPELRNDRKKKNYDALEIKDDSLFRKFICLFIFI
jgi:hypothetical protein